MIKISYRIFAWCLLVVLCGLSGSELLAQPRAW